MSCINRSHLLHILSLVMCLCMCFCHSFWCTVHVIMSLYLFQYIVWFLRVRIHQIVKHTVQYSLTKYHIAQPRHQQYSIFVRCTTKKKNIFVNVNEWKWFVWRKREREREKIIMWLFIFTKTRHFQQCQIACSANIQNQRVHCPTQTTPPTHMNERKSKQINIYQQQEETGLLNYDSVHCIFAFECESYCRWEREREREILLNMFSGINNCTQKNMHLVHVKHDFF